MDSFGVFATGEWESSSKMFSDEEFDFTLHDDIEGLHFITPSTFCPTSEANESLFYSSNTNLNSSFGSNCSSSTVFNNIPTSTPETYFFSNHNSVINGTVFMSMVDEKIWLRGSAFHDIAMEDETCPINQYMNGGESQATTAVVPTNELQLKRKFDEDDRVLLNVVNSSNTNAKKKSRASRDVQKSNKKNVVQSKKNQNQNVSPKGNIKGEESINGGSHGQSSTSTYNSDDDNASQETNNGESKALNLNGKPGASKGTATDPQSLYARKRRERINERLKILQNLVPNGTKVDISTMLEETVHYVKFLQLQIKLLSSDDLWMYAPLAYNGIDLCLNQKIS